MGKDYVILASEARRLTDNSNKQLQWIYKEIRERAEQGQTSIIWEFSDTDEAIINRSISELTKNGYSVSRHFDEIVDCPNCTRIKIYW